ncbi:NADP-dependent oxidoreductase [Enterobacter asburiae]|uniref:NADP-dependent oxidoreductase n=1 Tax=Enterobacter asburiae TaxID=61645 RepID=UPI0011D23021|nr:NADP-dependent oxidoreductase [Enterobacter asburiae]
MNKANFTNLAWVLASRPNGQASEKNFRLITHPIRPIRKGEMLLQTMYLSLDPYMRGRMDDRKSYIAPALLNQPMVGSTVSRVIDSARPDFESGDVVLASGGWQKYSISNGTGVVNINHLKHPSWALGILGMPGFTAYMGLLDIGKPQAGETLVVAAATGPVGATVGQLAKLWGCHVVGVAGNEEKCRHAVEILGFSSCINHKRHDFSDALSRACPGGIDIYFENVGGKVFDTIFPLLNPCARIPVCGLVSVYNEPSRDVSRSDITPPMLREIIRRRILLQGFIISQDYGDRYHELFHSMISLTDNNKIHYLEHVTEGLENAPGAFFSMLDGSNFGKTVIKVS